MKLKVKLLIIIMLLMIIAISLFIYIEAFSKDRVRLYIETTTKNISSEIFAEILQVNINDKYQNKDILEVKSSGEEISSVYINTNITNEILENISVEMNEFVSGDFTHDTFNVKIPFSLLFSEYIIKPNFKNGINVTIYPLTNYECTIDYEIEEYGINNSMLEVNILLSTEYYAFIPFNKQVITSNIKVNLACLMIQGKIPLVSYK